MKFDLYSALQARSHGEVRSNEETDQMRPEGQVYGVGGGTRGVRAHDPPENFLILSL